jgi:hypothetical protein
MSIFSSSLTERLMSLKHDLGKYVAWHSANLEDEEWRDGSVRLTAAVQRDVLSTRTTSDGLAQPAWVVFEACVEGMTDVERERCAPELARVDAHVRWMKSIGAGLTSGESLDDHEIRAQMLSAQGEIRGALSELVRRARGG